MTERFCKECGYEKESKNGGKAETRERCDGCGRTT